MEDYQTSSKRKEEHIKMALESVVNQSDDRFNYEPLLSAMPSYPDQHDYHFLGFSMLAPIWISSMTGGAQGAQEINSRLAKSCGKFGLGMGLGSCRGILFDNKNLEDFNVKKYMPNQALFANLGIAQIEELIANKALDRIPHLIDRLQADGLIIHINPFQEWLQPEGDYISTPPYISLEILKASYKGKLIVKEVGQGMGKKSLEKLFDLKVDAIEFGAIGGTNFSKLELLRSQNKSQYDGISAIGHNTEEMISYCNDLRTEKNQSMELIISGGIQGFLDGYYSISTSKNISVYGQAGAFLKKALIGQKELDEYIYNEIIGWQFAKEFLEINEKRQK